MAAYGLDAEQLQVEAHIHLVAADGAASLYDIATVNGVSLAVASQVAQRACDGASWSQRHARTSGTFGRPRAASGLEGPPAAGTESSPPQTKPSLSYRPSRLRLCHQRLRYSRGQRDRETARQRANATAERKRRGGPPERRVLPCPGSTRSTGGPGHFTVHIPGRSIVPTRN